MFWTGTGSIPPGGFDKKLVIQFYSMERNSRRLPSAHTCACILRLPRGIQIKEELYDLMQTAVTCCHGFGLI